MQSHNQNDATTGPSSLPPPHPVSAVNIDSTEALEVEIKDLKTVAVQPYYASSFQTSLRLVKCLKLFF